MKVKKNNPKLAVNIIMQEPRDRERNYSPGEQNIITKKQIVSLQKQTGNGKSKLEMAKANLLRQK